MGIDWSDAVIVNMQQQCIESRDRKEKFFSYNPNVLFEIGYAAKADKALLLIGHPEDKLPRPSNIQHLVVETVSDSMELVQLLYYGFR